MKEKVIYIQGLNVHSQILTGPTQLRTITACLHIAANESGSFTSDTMMSTVLSSGLPKPQKENCLLEGNMENAKHILTDVNVGIYIY